MPNSSLPWGRNDSYAATIIINSTAGHCTKYQVDDKVQRVDDDWKFSPTNAARNILSKSILYHTDPHDQWKRVT